MITIWHNPRCSKSRKTLALLEEKGADANVIEYLNTPPTVAELKAVLATLGMKAEDIVRRSQSVYKELELKGASEEMLLAAMAANPILIERPIVINGDKAAIGRPPENVLDII